MKWHRREFLQLGALSTTAALAGCGSVFEAPITVNSEVDPDAYDGGLEVAFVPLAAPVDETTFPLAACAGDLEQSRALVKVHVATSSVVRLRVWREGVTAGHVVMVHDDLHTADEAGFASVVVGGLAPATRYTYAAFSLDDAGRSDVGTFRTLFPSDWLAPVHLAGMTCTSWQNQPWQAGQRIGEENVDLLVHLGDMAYNDDAITLDEYRANWRRALGDPGYRAALQGAGLAISWDDHEFTNNLNPETLDPQRLADAKHAFFEALPVSPGPAGQLWRSLRFGRSVEVFVLDCRTERRPSLRTSAAEAYLGAEQLSWLKAALTASPCHFKVLLNSVPMSLMPELWASSGDRWQGYAPAREELLQFLEQEQLDDVWFLSGDFHLGFVGRVEAEGPRRCFWEVAVGPSGNLGNPLGLLAESEEYRQEVFPSSQFLYGKGALAATFLTFDPVRDVVRVRFVAADSGVVLFDEELSREVRSL
ncbi:MAG: alkaline phosphatase D family protein [Myxococcota bacterium]